MDGCQKHVKCDVVSVVAEILALKIHENANIQGFELESLHEEIKTVQHADDLTVLLKNAQSLSHTLSTIREFSYMLDRRLT